MTTLRQYYDALSVEQRAAIAARAGTKPIYLYQLAYGYRQASPAMARKLHEATGYAVPLHAMRPDIWDAA